MNGWAVAAFYVAVSWIILRAIRDWHRDVRRERERTSFLVAHQRDVAYRQREREIAESRRIGWRR